MIMCQSCFDIIPSIIYFIERKCWSGWFIKDSVIDFHDLTYVYEGTATYIVNSTPVTLNKGDFLYIPNGSLRQAYTDPDNPMQCFAFNFIYHSTDVSLPQLPFPQKFRIHVDNNLLELYREFNKIWLQKSPGYKMKTRAIFMLILHKLLAEVQSDSTNQSNDKRIEKIKEYILNHYHQKIDMKVLAETVKLNPVYMGAYFKKNTGSSINKFVNHIRIRKAEDLLVTEGYNISEVAYLCGFEDVFYFSKVFKQLKGFPPSRLLK